MPPINKRNVGRRIAQAREQAGLTQKQLADLLDISEGSVSNYERGLWKKGPPYEHMSRMEEVTNRPVGYLLYGDSMVTSLESLLGDMRADRAEIAQQLALQTELLKALGDLLKQLAEVAARLERAAVPSRSTGSSRK